MPVESAADRLVFLSDDEFGATAAYTPAGGPAVPGIVGIFDRPAVAVETGDAAPAIDGKPTFTCRSADLPPAAAGGDAGDRLAVTVEGVAYGPFAVLDLMPDGAGMTHIVLGRAP